MAGEFADLEGVRQFHIGDILSVTTGRLVSPRRIDGIYDILNYMTGDNLFTHQLPRALDECAPSLIAQHPDLEEVEIPDGLDNPEKFSKFIGDVAVQYGETRPVLPLIPEDHTPIDPVAELHLMGFGDKVITVEIDPPSNF